MDKLAALELARSMLASHSDTEICDRTGLEPLEVVALRAIRATDPTAVPLRPARGRLPTV